MQARRSAYILYSERIELVNARKEQKRQQKAK